MKSPHAYTLARRDRITLVIILILLTGWEFTKWIWPHRTPAALSLRFISNAQRSPGNPMRAKDSPAGGRHSFDSANPGDTDSTLAEMPTLSCTLPSRINLASAMESDLVAVGFPLRIAKNIIRYQAAGGELPDSAALMRIYGMSAQVWRRVAPCIAFPANKKPVDDEYLSTPSHRITDLNTADEDDLDALPGIGPAFAGRIIRYRNMLGGFASPDQLRECYGLPPETADKIIPLLRVSSPPRTISVNHIRLDTLYHPYVPRKILRVLEAYKKQHGDLNDRQALRTAFPADTSWISRMLPYLDFSPSSPEYQDTPSELKPPGEKHPG